MNNFVIAQIFGVIGIIFSVLSMQMGTKRNIMIMLLCLNLASALNFWFLDSISGSLVCFFAVFETFINYLFDEKNKKVPIYLIAFYVIVNIGLGVSSYHSLIDIIPIVCALLYCATVCTNKESIIRKEMFANQSLWLIYDIIVKAYMFSISNVLTLVSIVISMIRYDLKDGKKMEKESYAVNLGDIVCRRARKTDNMGEIATLIYQTDPYIYPYWFENDIDKAKEFLSDKILMPGFIFNYENLYIAEDKRDNRIIGLVVALDPTVDLNFDYSPYLKINDNHKETIEKYIYECIHDVVNNDAMYIMNCAVLEECRGRRIGTKLLGHFISNMERAGFENYRLDCLLHNLRAKNLYHSLGFKEMEEVKGFGGYVKDPVEVVVFKRHKGDYLPEEFQKEEKYVGIA